MAGTKKGKGNLKSDLTALRKFLEEAPRGPGAKVDWKVLAERRRQAVSALARLEKGCQEPVKVLLSGCACPKTFKGSPMAICTDERTYKSKGPQPAPRKMTLALVAGECPTTKTFKR